MADKQDDLKREIQRILPEFAAACAGEGEVVLLHQDAFAANYENAEYLLLGKAIKYAGLAGKTVTVVR